MSLVTIEGSLTAASVLPRGERKTVERTPYIDKLIRNGFVFIVDGDTPVTEPHIYIENNTDQDIEVEYEVEDLTEPAADAPRREWAAFLTEHGVSFKTKDTRDQLIAAWGQAKA